MKKRLFVLAAPLALLVGCGNDPGSELLGYWVRRRQNGRIQAMLRIHRDGQNLIITIAEFSFFGGNSPRETARPLVFSRDLIQHGIQSELGLVPVVAAGDGSAVLFKDARFERSTKEEYDGFLAVVLEDRRF